MTEDDAEDEMAGFGEAMGSQQQPFPFLSSSSAVFSS